MKLATACAAALLMTVSGKPFHVNPKLNGKLGYVEEKAKVRIILKISTALLNLAIKFNRIYFRIWSIPPTTEPSFYSDDTG